MEVGLGGGLVGVWVVMMGGGLVGIEDVTRGGVVMRGAQVVIRGRLLLALPGRVHVAAVGGRRAEHRCVVDSLAI